MKNYDTVLICIYFKTNDSKPEHCLCYIRFHNTQILSWLKAIDDNSLENVILAKCTSKWFAKLHVLKNTKPFVHVSEHVKVICFTENILNPSNINLVSKLFFNS